MKLEPFELERLQSIWENRVTWNLSESGGPPLTPAELADAPEHRSALFGQELGYTQTNGTPELRAAIARLYPGATIDHVQVTNGGSEANCIVLCLLVDRGDEVVIMAPNYMQAYGLVAGLGADVKRWPLLDGELTGRWCPDLAALERL